MANNYFVYIATNHSRTLYVGVTNDLAGRVWTHREHAVPGFTKQHDVTRLMWFEAHNSIEAAITREKQIKRWKRDWKIDLFRESNPNWDDLYPSIAKLYPERVVS